jgi:HSP20 family protein
MPELVIWKRQQLNKLRRDMDRMMERVLGDFRPASSPGIGLKRPQFDLIETDKDLILRAEIPGINPNDIEIDITDNIITIEVEIRKDSAGENERHYWIERRYGTFSRSIPIPRRIILSRVKATYEKGVLKVVMPKYSGEEKRGLKVKLG